MESVNALEALSAVSRIIWGEGSPEARVAAERAHTALREAAKDALDGSLDGSLKATIG